MKWGLLHESAPIWKNDEDSLECCLNCRIEIVHISFHDNIFGKGTHQFSWAMSK